MRNMEKEFGEISAGEAIMLLCEEFGYSQTPFTFVTTSRRVTLQTLKNASCMGKIAAYSVGPIEFYGGPPGKRQYYVGSLLTMLYDAILYSWKTTGQYEELVTELEAPPF